MCVCVLVHSRHRIFRIPSVCVHCRGRCLFGIRCLWASRLRTSHWNTAIPVHVASTYTYKTFTRKHTNFYPCSKLLMLMMRCDVSMWVAFARSVANGGLSCVAQHEKEARRRRHFPDDDVVVDAHSTNKQKRRLKTNVGRARSLCMVGFLEYSFRNTWCAALGNVRHCTKRHFSGRDWLENMCTGWIIACCLLEMAHLNICFKIILFKLK